MPFVIFPTALKCGRIRAAGHFEIAAQAVQDGVRYFMCDHVVRQRCEHIATAADRRIAEIQSAFDLVVAGIGALEGMGTQVQPAGILDSQKAPCDVAP